MLKPNKKHCLLFTPYFYPYLSGLTTYPFYVCRHLAKKYTVTILTFPHDTSLKSQDVVQGMQIIRMPYWFKISKGFISPQSIIIFFKKIKKADHIFLNLPSAEGIFLVLLAKIFQKPITAIYHCQVDLGPSILSRVITTALNIIIDIQLSLVDAVIGYTKDYVDHHPQINKHLHKTIILTPPVPQLFPDKDYLNGLLQQKKDAIWIGFSGRIAREKGLEYLIQSMTQLSLLKPVVLVCAGPYGKAVAGEEAYFQRIKHLLHQTNTSHLLLGPLSSGRLGSFYQAIDVLALPSINHTEAFGMVQCEAMMAGTPVIATNLPGVRVPVTFTGMGEIVEPKIVSI
jgi:glycosyltransferase involved in cell wall biosynthesis